MDKTIINTLIVDNSKDFRNILSAYLSSQEDMVVTGIAVNGVEALKLIEEKKPDLLILDIVIPIINGLEVLEKLYTMKLNPKPRIIVLSAIDQDNIIKRAKSLGADYYIVKPFDIEVFINKIRRMLNRPAYNFNVKASLTYEKKVALI